MSSQDNLPSQPAVEPESSAPPPSCDAPAPSSPPSIKQQQGNQASRAENAESAATPPPANPRLAALEAKRVNLEATLADLQAQRAALVAETKLPSGLDMPADWSDEQKTKQALATSNGVIKEHIQLLHKYNEIKGMPRDLPFSSHGHPTIIERVSQHAG
jgi:hypothetical protein